MSDIIFKCSGCSMNLAVSDTLLGQVFRCPSCRAGIQAPSPVLRFLCPSCSCDLSAPYELRNEVVACPNCESGLRLPSKLILPCPACFVNLEVDDAYYRQSAGLAFECPECGSQVMIPRADAGSAAGTEKESQEEGELQQEAPAQEEGELQPEASTQETPLKDEPEQQEKKPMAQFESGFAQRTMRLDVFMEDISQADNLKEGRCPYCNTALLRLHNHAYVCKRCNKVIQTFKRTLH